MMEFDLIRLIAGGMYLPTKVTPVLACFDESGKFRDTEMTTFGGVMIRRTDFCHSWRQQLQEYSLPYTSMKDAMSFSGPFKPWGDMADGKLKRDELIRRFGKLLLESGVIRTHSTIPSVEFNTLSRADKKSLGGDPQYACFQACIMGLLTQFPDAQIHILCDLSTQYSEKCLKLYHKLREREPLVKDRTSGICFGDDEVHSGLQAADMVTYCARSKETKGIPVHPLVQEISQWFAGQDSVRKMFSATISGDGFELTEGDSVGGSLRGE